MSIVYFGVLPFPSSLFAHIESRWYYLLLCISLVAHTGLLNGFYIIGIKDIKAVKVVSTIFTTYKIHKFINIEFRVFWYILAKKYNRIIIF